MFYLYVLINHKCDRTYTGSTGDLQRRIKDHNEGKVRTSKPYRPYELLYSEELSIRKEALERERFFKSTSGRRQLKALVNMWKDKKFNGEI